MITVKLRRVPVSACVIVCHWEQTAGILSFQRIRNGFLSVPSICPCLLSVSNISQTSSFSQTRPRCLLQNYSLKTFCFQQSLPFTDVQPHQLPVDYTERIKLEHSCHRASSSLSGFLCCQISTAATTNILRHHIVKCLNLSMNPCCDLNPASKNSGLMSLPTVYLPYISLDKS